MRIKVQRRINFKQHKVAVYVVIVGDYMCYVMQFNAQCNVWVL